MSNPPTGSSVGTPEQIERFRLSDQYQTLKSNVHRHLISQIDERNLDIYSWPADKLERFVAEQVRRFVVDERLPVSQRETEALMRDARNELMGFGPIQHLVDDDSVNDIVVNGPHNVFVERAGKLYSVPVRFNDNNHVIRVIQRILAPLGRRVDESTPMVDARLPDGSRVNAIIPPIALDGPCLSIRKFRKIPLSADDLLRFGSITQAELDYLRQRVEKRTNLIVVGGTGSGKTTSTCSASGFRRASASSRWRTPPSCACSTATSCAWKAARPISRASAPSAPATWCATPCACVPTVSSSARCAATRCWTCCRP